MVQKGSDGEYHNMPFDSVIGGEQFYDLLTVGLRISQSQVDLSPLSSWQNVSKQNDVDFVSIFATHFC